jgi:hypothetical protein
MLGSGKIQCRAKEVHRGRRFPVLRSGRGYAHEHLSDMGEIFGVELFY